MTNRHLITAAAAAAAALTAVLPATGSAAVYPFGSDLTPAANRAEARQADTVYWQTSFADGRPPVAPVDGQIRLVRIKGVALSDRVAPLGVPPVGGERDFHMQVMQPLPDGRFQIRNPGGTSGFLSVPPRTADPQGVTEYSSDAGLVVNLCARAGDSIVFNTIGGWDAVPNRTGPYPDGTPLQIFSSVPSVYSVVSEFTGDNQTNNGAIITPKAGPGRELLMQVVIGNGRHGTALCAGGTAGAEGPLPLSVPDPGPAPPPPQPPPPPGQVPPPPPPLVQLATIPASQRVTVSKQGKLSVSLFCKLTTSRCTGRVRVLRRTGKAISLGAAKFNIAGKKTGHATIYLNKTGRQLFFKRGKGRLSVKIQAVTDPGGATRTSSLVTTLRRR